MSGRRLGAPQGSRIDRNRPLSFRFGSREVSAFAGDTVASALLAAGIREIGPSFKLRRPRGVFSCGAEEPNALLDTHGSHGHQPLSRLTQLPVTPGLQVHLEPGRPLLDPLSRHFAPWLAAGFYYKTMMWPSWSLYEPTIRELAASSQVPDRRDAAACDEVSQVCELLVVGGGLAGMQAALAAAVSGRKVTLVDSDLALGGWALGTGDALLLTQVQGLQQQLRQAGVQVLLRTTALAVHDHSLVIAVQHADGGDGAFQRLWKLRAAHIILAAGGFERPMLFPDNDRPGVMLAGAVERHAALYAAAGGERAVVVTACDAGHALARRLPALGMEVAAIVDRRPRAQITAALDEACPVYTDAAVVAVAGRRSVQGLTVVAAGHTVPVQLDADLVASLAGYTPNVALHAQAGGGLGWLSDASMFVPTRAAPGLSVVGGCAGVLDLPAALEHAEAVGRLLEAAPPAPAGAGAGISVADTRPSEAALRLYGRRPGLQFVDLHNDVTTADVQLAARESYRSVEHLKRYTTLGMAPDQGKTSNVNGLVVLGATTGREAGQVGTTRFRPPYVPVTLNALAAGRQGARLRVLKRLAARGFHEARGAVFEEFGSWERPSAYPRPGESLVQAAEREAAQVRRGVGLFDGSPLGKIEVIGPDAAAFLDRMYVGTMSTLAVGSARYGVLLNENGVVVDDGIVSRLGPEHFWVNTTSSGADRAALAFEEWLQCEFVQMRVAIVPVTAQWGNVTVSGPKAWQLLERLGFEASLAPAAMKHMTLQPSTWRGRIIRVLRASFNGELGYEINLPPSASLELLEALWQQGQDLDVTPYGVEALMIMRTEKGFIHVGADTDGTTLPQDVGLARGIPRKASDFVGRRSLLRPAATADDRLQLVGLQPVDRRTRLTVGAHLARLAPPSRSEGHVTSACFSPALQQPIGLAMLTRGQARLGERLQAWHLGKPVEVEVVPTPFFDPAGERLHG